MPNYEHQNNPHQDKRSKRRTKLYVGAFFVVLLMGAAFLFFDLFGGQTNILESTGTVLSVKERNNTMVWDEKFFRFETPQGWEKVSAEYEGRYDVWRYNATGNSSNGRYFEVYMNGLPGGYSYNKIQEVNVKDDSLVVKSLSEQCYIYGNETGRKTDYIHDITQVEYKEIDFRCHPSNILNKIGAFSKATGNGLELTGSLGTNTFYLVYVDDNIQQRNSIFVDILESFKAK